jgi:acetylornithine aminotransferase
MRKLLTNSLMSTYQRLPISFNKGEGVWLHAKNGDKYLDALSGIAVNTLGYSHPKFVKAISDQIKNLIMFPIYTILKSNV